MYCNYNYIIRIRKLIQINVTLLWNYGLYGACQGGHMDIVNLMIEKGADRWNSGLVYACSGGHIAIVKLMIEKGANQWNWGLEAACVGGHIDIVKIMIEKGATQCVYCKKSIEKHLSKSE